MKLHHFKINILGATNALCADSIKTRFRIFISCYLNFISICSSMVGAKKLFILFSSSSSNQSSLSFILQKCTFSSNWNLDYIPMNCLKLGSINKKLRTQARNFLCANRFVTYDKKMAVHLLLMLMYVCTNLVKHHLFPKFMPLANEKTEVQFFIFFWKTVIYWIINIADWAKLWRGLGDEGGLPSLESSATGTDVFIKFRRVTSTCVSINNIAPSTKKTM